MVKAELDRYQRRERVSKFAPAALFAIAMAVVVFAYASWMSNTYGDGEWRHKDVFGVVEEIVAEEGYGDQTFRIHIKLNSGKVILLSENRLPNVRVGDAVKLRESSHTKASKRIYERYRTASNS